MSNPHPQTKTLESWRFGGGDAVLVAVSWQLLLSHSLDTTSRILLALVLGTSVWSVYLLDRFWDASFPGANGRKGNLAAVILLTITAPLAIVLLALPRLPGGVLWAGALTATACLIYYAVRLRNPVWQRGRAGVVAAIFGAGVIAPLTASGAGIPPAWIVGFLALLAANASICLRCEPTPQSGTAWLPLNLLALAGFLTDMARSPTEALAGIVATVLLAATAIVSPRLSLPLPATQILADLALWMPAMVGVVVRMALSRPA